MINAIRRQLQERKLRNQLRRYYAPDGGFLKSAKNRFTQEIRTELKPARIPIHHHVVKWRYALVAGLIAVSMTGGVMTYADANNVPASHPLYNFKRFSEQVRLGLATPQQQVALHQSFAQRRLHEIEEMKAEHPGIDEDNDETVGHLSDDFQNEANDTIDQAEKLNFMQDQRQALCQKILDTVDDTVHSRHLDHLRSHCQAVPGQ